MATTVSHKEPFIPPMEYKDLHVTFTPEEIHLIRSSWGGMKDDPSASERAIVQGTASAFFCQQFYENMLGEYPQLKVLFPSIKSQASSMAGILSLVISQLDNIPRVTDILISLGKRHSRIIGVEVQHYEIVGNALLKTLQDRAGPDFTIELENAWTKLYSFMANVMLQAGEDPPVPYPNVQQPQHQALYPVLTSSSSISESSSSAPASTTQGSAPAPRSSAKGPTGANGNAPAPNAAATGPAAAAPVDQGYNPGNSYFRTKGKKKKLGKNQDCSIM